MLLSGSLYVTAFAQADSEKSDNKDVYQEIREKLSAEYGIEVRPATDEELKKAGLSREEVEKNVSKLSAAEFEKELRKEIEQEKEISKKAIETYLKARTSDEMIQPASVEYFPVTCYADISGGVAVLEGEVVYGLIPTPKWSSVNTSYILSGAAYASPPYFFANSWNYSVLNAGRTISCQYGGYLLDANGNYLGSATRTALFNA